MTTERDGVMTVRSSLVGKHWLGYFTERTPDILASYDSGARAFRIPYNALPGNVRAAFSEDAVVALRKGHEMLRRAMPSDADTASEHESGILALDIVNLPSYDIFSVRDIRHEHLGRFVGVRGIVKSTTQVNPRLVEGVWSCLRCGHTTTVPQRRH